MEKKELSNGKRSIKSLNRFERLELHYLIGQRHPHEWLCDKYNIDLSEFLVTYQRILKHLIPSTLTHTFMGFKNEPYESEEFMLNGYPEYDWKSLSEEEKYFYKNYERRERKFRDSYRTCQIDRELEQNI